MAANALETIFPRQASNDYRGGAVPFCAFCLLAAVKLFSSTTRISRSSSRFTIPASTTCTR